MVGSVGCLRACVRPLGACARARLCLSGRARACVCARRVNLCTHLRKRVRAHACVRRQANVALGLSLQRVQPSQRRADRSPSTSAAHLDRGDGGRELVLLEVHHCAVPYSVWYRTHARSERGTQRYAARRALAERSPASRVRRRAARSAACGPSKQTNKHTHEPTSKQTNKPANKQAHKHTNTQTHKTSRASAGAAAGG